jgi:hypothetical protein
MDKGWKIEADDQTFDRVMDKALELGLSVLPGKIIHIDNKHRARALRMWLGYCGIKYSPVTYEIESLPHPERIAYHLRITTLGRKAFGIC